ncbi:MAG: 50S ribosomal protein L17 [Balneolaceae bacterium]
MRHLKKGFTLGRKTAHRKATFQALSIALIKEKRIQTTLAKAKALRSFIEPLITKAKTDNSHNRRQVFSSLQNKEAVSLLFNEIGPKTEDRPGGYTRLIKIGYRSGDSAHMAIIELVDYNDVKPDTSKGGKKKTRRAGKTKKTTTADKPVSETVEAKKKEKKKDPETATNELQTDVEKEDSAEAKNKKETKQETKEESSEVKSEKSDADSAEQDDNSDQESSK